MRWRLLHIHCFFLFLPELQLILVSEAFVVGNYDHISKEKVSYIWSSEVPLEGSAKNTLAEHKVFVFCQYRAHYFA